MHSLNYHSLYLHVPFCRNICDYCVLYSVVSKDQDQRQAYFDQMIKHLERNSKQLQELETIFIGGGTPTQPSVEELRPFFQAIKDNVTLKENYEFSVECNPSTVTKEKLELLKEFGVNRLSFGAQSSSRSTRKTLGRRTTHEQLIEVVEMASSLGFEDLNVDLIYAVPGQELEDWQGDLELMMELPINHLSAYSLIIEEGAALSKRIHEVDDDLAVDMYELAGDFLTKRGFERYEISNYSKSGKQCRHNLDIWLGKTYLGIGPAAASFDGERRWNEIADLAKWLDGSDLIYDDMPREERAGEVVAFGFRTNRGWKETELDFWYSFSDWREMRAFEYLFEEGLLIAEDGYIRATERGLLFADTIAEEVMFNTGG